MISTNGKSAPRPEPLKPQYSFTSFQVANPTAPPPGDRLDSEYARINKVIADTIAWVGTALNSDGSLKVSPPAGPPTAIAGSAGEALANDYAVLAGAWSEYMPGTIPPNILAVMDVTGDHWSSRWWANRAAQLVQDFIATPNAGMPVGGIPSTGSIGNANSLWTNYGAHVVRQSDRLFVGAAADVTAGNSSNSPTNWLSSLPNLNYTGTFGQQIVLSTTGTLAFVAGTRSSDCRTATGANTGAAIGVSGYTINDDTLPGRAATAEFPVPTGPRAGFPNPAAWAGYFEARRNVGVVGATVGIEIDIDNAGSTITLSPSAPSLPGQTIGLCVASGGATTTQPASAALLVSSNGAKFRKGIVFHDIALDPAVGAGGAGVAVELATGQSLRWLSNTDAVQTEVSGNSAGFVVNSNVFVGTTLNTGLGVSTGFAAVEIGSSRSADGGATLDFHATPSADYEFRLLRNGGVNGNAAILQQGSGGISVINQGASALTIPGGSQVWLYNATPVDTCGFVVQHHTVAAAAAIAATNTTLGTQVSHWMFRNSAGVVGAINTTGSVTTYATSSDARLKRDETPAVDLTALKNTRIWDFTWISDGAKGRGVMAQDQEAVLPGMIVPPPKDVPDASYMADYSKLVPDLVVGWQAHEAELQAIYQRLLTLEGKPA